MIPYNLQGPSRLPLTLEVESRVAPAPIQPSDLTVPTIPHLSETTGGQLRDLLDRCTHLIIQSEVFAQTHAMNDAASQIHASILALHTDLLDRLSRMQGPPISVFIERLTALQNAWQTHQESQANQPKTGLSQAKHQPVNAQPGGQRPSWLLAYLTELSKRQIRLGS